VKLELYALYKYLTVAHAPNTSRPSIFDMTGRAKWQAWEQASKDWEGKPDADAEARYLEIASKLGWTEVKKYLEAPEESKTAETAGQDDAEAGGGGGMGVSVSRIAHSPGDLEEAEDSLHGAVLSNDVGKLTKYLDQKGLDVDQKDEYGFTALHLAADRGYLYAVKALVSKGANIGIKDPDDHTAVSLAHIADHQDIVLYLEKTLEEAGDKGQGA